MDSLNANVPSSAASRPDGDPPTRVLLVMEPGGLRDQLARIVALEGHDIACAERLETARLAVVKDRYDLVIVTPELPDGSGLEMAEMLQRLRPSSKVMVASPSSCFEDAVDAMRRGAVDYLSLPMEPASIRIRITQALGKCRFDREREQRLLRLKSICRKLNSARHEISQQVDLLCTDLAHAYQEIAGQLSEVAMVSEFRTLLRQELDVESLLRTALEYLLTRTGPTNAAVFLPGENSEYNLGAYVNYSCPRETATVLLQHLGEHVCPQMERETDIVRFADAKVFAEFIGGEPTLVAGSQVVAFSAMHDDECMAVIVLFRSEDEPFGEQLPTMIDALRSIFAEQIATIIRIHHRGQPEWPREALGDDDAETEGEWGLAA
ncbi:MAG: response regulator [Phycisphaerales bacterium]|nr:response regulator [Phycisphaerales bacterium]